MPTKVKINRLEHNIGKGQRPDAALSVPTHKERIVKRKAVRALRISSVVYGQKRVDYTRPFVYVSKSFTKKERAIA